MGNMQSIWETDITLYLFFSLLILFVGLLIFIITLIITIIKYKKTRIKPNFKKTILIMLLACLMICQYTPWFFVLGARNFFNKFSDKKDAFSLNMAILCLDFAAVTSIMPKQKGAIYLDIAWYTGYGLNFENVSKNFDKAYKYLKTYKYKEWKNAIPVYLDVKDYKKAAQIAEIHSSNNLRIAGFYLLANDLENALKNIEKSINEKPQLADNYAARGYIYKKLGKIEEAQKDYKKALSLAKNEKELKGIKSIYSDCTKVSENDALWLVDKAKKSILKFRTSK